MNTTTTVDERVYWGKPPAEESTGFTVGKVLGALAIGAALFTGGSYLAAQFGYEWMWQQIAGFAASLVGGATDLATSAKDIAGTAVDKTVGAVTGAYDMAGKAIGGAVDATGAAITTAKDATVGFVSNNQAAIMGVGAAGAAGAAGYWAGKVGGRRQAVESFRDAVASEKAALEGGLVRG